MAFLEVLPPVIAPTLVPLKQLHRQAPLVVLQRNVEQLVLENGASLTSYPFVAGNETGELLPQGALQLLDNVILPPLGVNIAVQLDAQCTLARLLKKKMGVQVLPCRLLASWENGVLSISYTADGQKYVLSVRLDETLELLAAANAARAEKDGGGEHEPEENQ